MFNFKRLSVSVGAVACIVLAGCASNPVALPADQTVAPVTTNGATPSPEPAAEASTPVAAEPTPSSDPAELGELNSQEVAALRDLAQEVLPPTVPDDAEAQLSRAPYDYAMSLLAPDAAFAGGETSLPDDVMLVRVEGPFDYQVQMSSKQQVLDPSATPETAEAAGAYFVIDPEDGMILHSTILLKGGEPSALPPEDASIETALEDYPIGYLRGLA